MASLFHATSPPFVSATSPKYFYRESLEGRRTETRERKGTSPEMFVAAAVRGRAIKCGIKKKSEKKEEEEKPKQKREH